MSDVMRRCMEWITAIGAAGMLLGVLLLTALVVLVVMLIGRTRRRSRGG